MSNYDPQLTSDEEIIYRAEMHKACYLPHIILGLLLFFPVGGVLLFYLSRVSRSRSVFMVTNKRLFLRTGVLRVQSADMPLKKCDFVSASQGIIGQALGYGTIEVSTPGAKMCFHFITDPFRFKDEINKQIDLAQKNQ